MVGRTNSSIASMTMIRVYIDEVVHWFCIDKGSTLKRANFVPKVNIDAEFRSPTPDIPSTKFQFCSPPRQANLHPSQRWECHCCETSCKLKSEIGAIRRTGHFPDRSCVPYLRHSDHRTGYSETAPQHACNTNWKFGRVIPICQVISSQPTPFPPK